MAIYTKFGSEISIVEKKDKGWLLCKRLSDNSLHEWHMSELRADEGQKEILEAALSGKRR